MINKIKLISAKPEQVFPLINKRFLYEFHWQCIPSDLGQKTYDEYISEKISPIFERIKKEIIDQNILDLKGLYGFFP